MYKRTGRPLLIKALNGYNACLFAYGQTGSGKTYTMLGTDDDKGVIPLMLDELFENVKAQREHGRVITVTMSMLEIYNEHLHGPSPPPPPPPPPPRRPGPIRTAAR